MIALFVLISDNYYWANILYLLDQSDLSLVSNHNLFVCIELGLIPIGQ